MLLQVDIGDGGGDGGLAHAGRAMQYQLLVLTETQQERPQQIVSADRSTETTQRQLRDRSDSRFQRF